MISNLRIRLFFLSLFLVGSIQLHSQAPQLQAVHTIADPGLNTIDVYITVLGLTLAQIQDLEFRSAVPKAEALPIGVNLAVAPGNSSGAGDAIANFSVSLQEGRVYIGFGIGVENPNLFAANPDGRDIGLGLSLTDNGRLSSTVPGEVQFLFSHGVTDASAIDIIAGNGDVLFNDARYGDLSGYLSRPAASEVFVLKDQAGAVLGAYDVDLTAYADSAMVFFLSGFLAPAQNQNGAALSLNAALPGGTVLSFPQANIPPSVSSPIADQVVAEDFEAFQAADLASVFSDPDDTDLTYSVVTDSNTLAEINGSALVISSVANFFGESQITVTASDSASSIADVFTLTISPVNDSPILSNVPDIQFPEDASATLALNPFVADVDNDSSEMNFTAMVISAAPSGPPGNYSHNAVKIDPADLIVDIDPLTNIASFSATVDSSGQFAVLITATDPGDSTDSDTIQVVVDAVNDRPSLTTAIPDTMIHEDSGMVLLIDDLNTFFKDPDSDSLAFAGSSDNESLALIINGAALSVKPAENFFGDAALIVTASDGNSSASDTFMVKVTNVNDSPTAFTLVSPPDSFRVMNGDPRFPVSFSWEMPVDVDGDTLEYEFSLSGANRDTTISVLTTNQIDFDGGDFWALGFYTWRVSVFDGTVFVNSSDTFVIEFPEVTGLPDENTGALPQQFSLQQNFPNPFNPNTTIQFELPEAVAVQLTIYNSSGQLMKTLVQSQFPPGSHHVVWDARNRIGEKVASGIYLYMLNAGDYQEVRKMLLLK